MPLSTPLSVTALGLATALGSDFDTACAAARAGLSRAAELDFLVESEQTEAEVLGAPGHRLWPPSDGFFQVGMWVRAGVEATRGMLRTPGVPPPAEARGWAGTAVIGLLPAINEDRFGWDLEGAPFLETVLDVAGLTIPSERLRLVHAGHLSLVVALEQASKWIAEREVERVLLIASDSYLDSPSLSWLSNAGRLKSPDYPSGAMPGEAAVALLVEAGGRPRSNGLPLALTIADVTRRAGPPLLEVDEDEEEEPPAPLLLDLPRVGRSLAEAMVRICERGAAANEPPEFFVDLNGEPWRAQAWGHALTQLRPGLDPDHSPVEVPAVAFGETGAASAPLALCLAAHAARRKVARNRASLVTSVGEDGAVGVIRLERP